MSIERRALSGTVVGALAFAVTAAQSLLLVPVLLGAWGPALYGAWLSFQSLFALLITLDSGHQAYVGNELSQLYFSDRTRLRRVLASGVWTAVAIGLLELLVVVGLWATGALPHALGLPPKVVSDEGLGTSLLIWIVMWAALGSVSGVVTRLLPPAGKFVRFTVWGIASRLLQTIAVLAAALLGARIVGATVAYVAMTFCYCVVLFVDLRSQLSELWPMHTGPSVGIGVRNFARSLVLTGSTTLTQLQQNGLNILVTGTLGAAALPALSTARTVASTFLQVANVVCAPLAPEMVRFHVNGEHDKLQATFAANWLVGGTVIQLGIVLALPVLAPLYALWTRHSLPFDRPLFALLAMAISLRTFGAPLQTYLASVNHLRALTTLNAVQSITVLGTAAIGLRSFGLRAAGMAVLGGEVAGSCILPLVFVAAQFSSPWRARFLRYAALAALPSLATAVGLLSFASDHHLSLFLCASAAGLLAMAWIQWRQLPATVKTRLQNLLPLVANKRAA